MMDAPLMAAILDSLKGPLLFADTQHVIRYINEATLAYYEEGTSLPGRSLPGIVVSPTLTQRSVVIPTPAPA